MKFWKGLLFRLLLSLMLPLTISWINDDINLSWQLLILCLTSVWCITDAKDRAPRHLKNIVQCFVIPSVLLMMAFLFAIYTLYPKAETWISHLNSETVLYFSFVSIFNSIKVEFNVCLTYYGRWILFLWKHRWKILKALTYIACVSCLLCYTTGLVSHLYLQLVREKSEETHITTNIPYRNFGQGVPISDITEYEQIYADIFIECMYATHFVSSTCTNGPALFFSTESIERYIGEDVRLECYLTEPRFTIATTKFYIRHEGKRVKASDRHLLKYEYDDIYNSMTIVLDIFLLEKTDFGMYECIMEHAEDVLFNLTDTCYMAKKDDCNSYLETVLFSTVQMKKKLVQIEPSVEVVYLNHFDTVRLRTYDFSTLIHTEAIVSYEYRLNNEGFNQSHSMFRPCSFQTQFLSIAETLLVNPFGVSIYFSDIEYVSTIELKDAIFTEYNDYVRFYTNIRFCAQPKIYGWHELFFLRHYYNSTTNKTEIFGYQSPITRLVWPGAKRWIFWYLFDDSFLYEELKAETLAKGGHNIDKRVLGLLHANEEKVQKFDDVMLMITVLVVLFGILKLVLLIKRNICRLFVMPVIKVILTRDNTGSVPQEELQRENNPHDVFILHSEEDYGWVSTSLVPYLEHDLCLSVCFPDRDFHQGGNTIHSVMAAMTNSRKVIVVLTPDYMAERGCYTLQVEHLLLPSLYEGGRNELSVLLLNLVRCEIPQPLKWNLDIKCIKWYDYPENESRKQLEWWIKQK